jgi:hypothetical protein
MFSFIRTDAKDRKGVPNHTPPAGREARRPQVSASPPPRVVVRTPLWGRLAPLIRRGTADARQRTEAPHRLSGRPVSFEDFRVEVERSRRYGHSFFLARFACGQADDGRFERSDRVAGAVRTLVRTVDLVWAEGRNVYVLLRECDREMGLAALERMRQALAELSSDKQKIEIGWAVFPEDGLTGGAVLDALCHNRVATIDALRAPSPGPTAVPDGGRRTRPNEMNPRVA